MVDVDVEYTDDDFKSLTNYALFSKHIRPMLMKENPKVSTTKMGNVVAAKWKEFARLISARAHETTPPSKPEAPATPVSTATSAAATPTAPDTPGMRLMFFNCDKKIFGPHFQ